MWISIIAMTEHYPEIWNDLTVPSEINKQDLIDRICIDAGELELLYSDPVLLKYMIKNWSRTEQHVWEKLAATLDLEYNPIYNLDVTYEETREPDLVKTRKPNLTKTRTPDLTTERTPDLTTERTPDLTTERTPDLATEQVPTNWQTRRDDFLDETRKPTNWTSTESYTNYKETDTAHDWKEDLKATNWTEKTTHGKTVTETPTDTTTEAVAGFNASTFENATQTTRGGSIVTADSGDDTLTVNGNKATTTSGYKTHEIAGSKDVTQSGTDLTEHRGYQTSVQSGTFKTTDTGTDTTTETGTDTTTETGTDTTTVTGTDTETETGTDTETTKGKETITTRRYGNQGVTMTQDMIVKERAVAVYNLYAYIVESFRHRFCLLVY